MRLEWQFQECLTRKKRRHIAVMLPMQPTTSLGLITCATIWHFHKTKKHKKQLNYAIIDEVDSILIDEARTPLVISGPTGDHAEVYIAIDKMIPLFTLQTETGEGKEVVVNIPGDYTLDQKQKASVFNR